MFRMTIIAIILSLAACGGGDPDPDKSIGPPDCRQEACR